MRTCGSKFLFIILFLVVDRYGAIPIDNGVEGDPEIECGASALTVNFNTRNNFEGHVYVKGRFAEQGCRSDESGRKIAGIVLPFTACGVQRTRSLNPRGIFVSTTVVITFHPQFLTKVDRAYTVQCFYMEADKTVSQELEVSEITTLFHSQAVPMPICRYDILDGSPTGQPIKYALIGQQVYHKWTCTTETTDIFCMVVHDCFVDDGADNKALLLNENGCALDRFLLQNLEYTSDLMAGREAHVFKYADKAALFFQCQITVTIKEPGQQCPRPQCPEPGGIGGGIVGGSGVTGPNRPRLPPSTGAPKVPGKPPSSGGQPSGPSPGLPPVTPGVPTTVENPAPTAGIGVEAPTRRHKGRTTPESLQTPAASQPRTEIPATGIPSLAPSYTGEPAQSPVPIVGPVTSGPPVVPGYTGEPLPNVPQTNAPFPPPAVTNGPSPGEVTITGAPSIAPSYNGEPVPSQNPSNVPNTGAASLAPAYTEAPSPSRIPTDVPLTGAPSIAPVYTGAPAPPNRVPLDVATGVPPSKLRGTVPPVTGAPQQPAATGPLPSVQPYGTNAPNIPPVAPPSQPSSGAPPPPAPNTEAPSGQQTQRPQPTAGVIGGYAGDLPLPLDFELRRKRSARFVDEVGTWDLRAQPIVTFDIDDDSSLVQDIRSRNQQSITTTVLPSLAVDGQLYCLTSVSLGFFLSFLVASTLTAVAFCFLFCVRNHSKQK